MSQLEARQELDRLVKSHGTSYSLLSRLLGRNPTYIQQYIKRGSPAWLDERDRRLLAQFFGVEERRLDGSGSALSDMPVLLIVPKLDVQASAGFGANTGLEATLGHYGFDRKWLQRISKGQPENLSIVQVKGDSMSPTLLDGDDILVDRFDGSASVRDGIYVLQREDSLLVKRIALGPSPGRIHITSDNPTYPSWHDCDVREVTVVGRVVWTGRRLT